MKFIPLDIVGAYAIDLELQVDARGSFARSFCKDEFEAHGLPGDWVQMSVSRNTRAGTLRGMHFQRAPHGEAKLVRVTRGAILDVLLDLRPGVSSYRTWRALQLSAENGRSVYIPPGVAHGFLTLMDDTDVLYAMDTRFVPGAAAGVRWNDRAFGISWPLSGEPILSERDAAYADWTDASEVAE